MSQYMQDCAYQWMRCCDTCGGWHHCSRPFDTTAEPDWECKSCTAKDAEISGLTEDNAALLEAGERVHDLAQHDESCRMLAEDADLCDCAMGDWAELLAQPHPGTALLEAHRKALGRATNEGLEAGAVYAETVTGGWVTAPTTPEIVKSVIATGIRLKKQPE